MYTKAASSGEISLGLRVQAIASKIFFVSFFGYYHPNNNKNVVFSGALRLV